MITDWRGIMADMWGRIVERQQRPAAAGRHPGGLSFRLAVALALFCGAGTVAATALAAVSGPCVDCHSMHNSQAGVTMKLDGTPSVGGSGTCGDCHADARSVLLRRDCIGCHAQSPSTGTSNVISGVPQVAHNASTDLAGGNFRYVFADDTFGHNVHGFGASIGTDSNLGNTPPGYDAGFDPAVADYDTTFAQIMCAGRNGCHGNRDEEGQIAALSGAHHADDSALRFGTGFSESGQGGTVGTSYRYLYKVRGAEDADWEATVSATDHNEYRGAAFNSSRSSQAWADISTMSQLCAECHGNFHSGSGLAPSGPWIRHPTDAVLPNSAPYSSYTSYSPLAPVARQAIGDGTTAASGSVTPGSDVVFCLSCHRAHGSPYADMLRWDYSTCRNATANSNCGCFVCHSDKD